MPKITYNQTTYSCREDELLLDALLRGGANVSFSCRGGACHVCLMRSKSAVPEAAQEGLSYTLREKGYFLPCICQPQNDMQIVAPRAADLLNRATVYKKEPLNHNVCRLLLEPATPLYYHPGQYINLWREDGIARSYSIASLASSDPFLELHIKRVPNGTLSNWIFDDLKKNQQLEIQGPMGECYYRPQFSHHKLLLMATGTGVSPLLGIVRDALNSQHRPTIHLYHGSHHQEGLYLHQTLLQLSQQHGNFYYTPCLDSTASVAGYQPGTVQQVALSQHPDLTDWTIFLCGNPTMIDQATEQVKQAGAEETAIYSDAFTIATSRNEPDNAAPSASKPKSTRIDYPPPDPEMWQALEEGKKLRRILDDFYTRIFDDPRLSPFFSDTTKSHSIGKQYSFLYKVFTGEDVYFGEDMTNAHHWMVISNELFDYREALFETTLRDHGLAEPLIKRFRTLSERYRHLIVKTKAINRMIAGVEQPVDGFGELILEVGSICDSCLTIFEPGEKVFYHLRLGTIYCSQCSKNSHN